VWKIERVGSSKPLLENTVMGQYWEIVNLNKQQSIGGSRLVQLIESHWLHNNLIHAFVSSTSSWNGDRIVVLGDYAEPSDFEDEMLPYIFKNPGVNRRQFKWKDVGDSFIMPTDHSHSRELKPATYTLINHDKMEVVHCKVNEQPGRLLLLLCTSLLERRGGGDIDPHEGFIGRWACDRIEVSTNAASDYSSYTDMSFRLKSQHDNVDDDDDEDECEDCEAGCTCAFCE
jgi:hypothetical protein